MMKKNTYFWTNNTMQGTKLIVSKIILNKLIDIVSISSEIMHFWEIDLLRELSQYVSTIFWLIAGDHCIQLATKLKNGFDLVVYLVILAIFSQYFT